MDNSYNNNYIQNNNKKIKLSNNSNNNNKNITLSNILIIKILEYVVEQSIRDDNHFILYNSLKLICKSWSIFIIPKLNFNKILFKNDDYIYTYLKVRDSIKHFSNLDTETNYKLCSDCLEISSSLSLIQSPTFSYGTYEIIDGRVLINNNSNSNNQFNNNLPDYNVYIDNQECGTIFNLDLNKIDKLESEYQSNKNQNQKNNNSNNNNNINGNNIEFSYNNSYCINSPRVRVPFFRERNNYLNNKTRAILEEFNYYDIKLVNIHIEKENSNYDHSFNKTLKKYQIGVYLLPLGISSFEGGAFIISDEDGQFIQDIKVNSKPHESRSNVYNFNWIAFSNDCQHKIKKIKNGTRVLLEFRIIVENPAYIKFKDDQAVLREFYEYKEPIQYSIKEQYFKLHFRSPFIDKYVNSNHQYIISIVQQLETLMNERDVDTGIILKYFYKSNVNAKDLECEDKVIWNGFKKGFGKDRIKISTFLISENWINKDINGEENDDFLNIKISNISSKEINQSSSIGKSSKNTLIFCSGRTNVFQSIFKSPRGLGDIYDYTSCFSAIIIKKNNK